MENLLRDIHYALRSLLYRPGFTVLVVITLALGIGANAAIFSMLDTVLFRALPVREPDQLINLQIYRPDGTANSGFSYAAFRDYRDLNQVCSNLFAYYSAPFSLSGTGGAAERVYGTIASGDYFTTLGVGPMLGRTFTAADDQTPGAHPVVVLSYGLWQRRFGAGNDAIGKSLEINKHQFTVIGVMPPNFTSTVRGFSSQLWLPLMMHAQAIPDDPPDALSNRGFIWLEVTGRLKPGITKEQAAASLETLKRRVDEANGRDSVERVGLTSGARGESFLVDDFAKPLLVMMVAVGLVLLIACANVANLLLARAGMRRKEIAVRLALGATRARLIQQLLTESFLLAFLGGATGLLIALWSDKLWAFIKPLGDFLPLTVQGGLNWRVLIFAFLVSAVTGLLFGLLPALQSSKLDFTPALKDGVFSWRGERRFQIRDLFVVSQVSVSVVVLVGAGLFVRSLHQMRNADVGYPPERMLIASLDPSLQGYDRAKGAELYRSLLERIRAVPGVRGATLAATVTPNAGGGKVEDTVQIEGRPTNTENIPVEYNRVGPDYFTTMNISIRGRDFSMQDRSGAPPVVIINESMARRVFPNENPLGKRFRFGDSGPFAKVVGVAHDGKYRSLREEPQFCVYEPFLMRYRPDMNLLVSSDVDAKALLISIRRELDTLDASIPLYHVRTLQEQIESVSSQEKAAAFMTSVFGILALVLTTIGLYGVMSYAVVQRTREIGIRMALGAQATDVVRLVLKSGMKLTLIGIIIGLAGALALTRLVKSLLFGITPTDLLTFTIVATGLILVALLACLIPARRAALTDPLVALKYE